MRGGGVMVGGLRGALAVAVLAVAFAGPVRGAGADDVADAGLRHIEQIEAAFQRAIERAQPAVVSILFEPNEPVGRFNADPFRRPFSARDLDQRMSANVYGSGVIIDRAGFVLTCYHVIRPLSRDRQYQLLIIDSKGNGYPARVHAADPRSDLAVLQLQGKVPAEMPAITIGDGGKLFRGQFVLAIGNPFGLAADGNTSASWGIVSNIRRRPALSMVSADPDERYSLHQSGTLIQTDARLNMGQSGGALINTKGELIGITMAMAAATGVETPGGFALPTDELTLRIIRTLREGREMEYGFLGISLQPDDPGQTTARRAPAVPGVVVQNVVPFVPAARAGIRPHDVITAINGQPIRSQSDLILKVGSLPVGTVLDTLVVRQGQQEPLRLKLPLAKYPVRGDIIATVKRPAWKGLRVDHLSVLADRYPLAEPGMMWDTGGVVIREVEEKSPAFEKGLRAEQVITRVNGRPVYSPDDFDQEVGRARPPVRLQLLRGQEIVLDETTAPAPQDKK